MGVDFNRGRAGTELLGHADEGRCQCTEDSQLHWLDVDDGLRMCTHVDQDFGITGDGDHIRISAYAGVR